MENVYNVYKVKYPILQRVSLVVEPMLHHTAGMCLAESCGDYVYISNKLRSKTNVPTCIKLNSNLIGQEEKILTLLHEIAHVLTPYVERKVKQIWQPCAHSHLFYANFLILIQMAYQHHFVSRSYTLTSLKAWDGKQAY